MGLKCSHACSGLFLSKCEKNGSRRMDLGFIVLSLRVIGNIVCRLMVAPPIIVAAWPMVVLLWQHAEYLILKFRRFMMHCAHIKKFYSHTH